MLNFCDIVNQKLKIIKLYQICKLSEEQKKGASIDAQLKSVEDYCKNSTPTKPKVFKILKVFSITNPFEALLQTAEINKWCALLCNYRNENTMIIGH